MLSDDEGVVSIWLGTVRTRKKWEAYLEEHYADGDAPMNEFADDLGESFYDHDLQEAHWQKDSVPVAELLNGVSYGDSFLPPLLAACAELGVATANAFVVLFDQRAAAEARERDRYRIPIVFAGSFAYQTPRDPSQPERRPDDHAARVTAVAIAGGVALTGASTGELRLWRLGDGASLGVLPAEAVSGIQRIHFDAAGRRALIVGGGLSLWEPGGDAMGHVTQLGRHSGGMRIGAAAITRDGALAASGGAQDFDVKLWDLAARREVACLKEDFGPITAMTFAPDDEHLFVANDRGIVQCFEVAAARLAWKARVHDVPERTHATIVDLAIDREGRAGLTGGFIACLFDTRDGRVLRRLGEPKKPAPQRVIGVHLHEGRAYLVEEQGRIAIHRTDNGGLVGTIQAHSAAIGTAATSPDGRRLVTGSADRTVRIWNLETSELLAQYPMPPADLPRPASWQDDPTSISAIATDGTDIVIGEHSGRVHLVRLDGPRLTTLRD